MSKEYINSLKSLDAVEQYRKEMNEACDKRSARIKTLNKGIELSESSFGYIKECFENLAPALFKTKEGRNIIKKYSETIKESKTLNTLHTIYENIKKTSKDSDIDFLVNNIVSENIKLKEKEVNESSKKLGLILSEAYLYLGERANDLLAEEKNELDKAVRFISENKKSIKNISDFSSAVKVIREEVEKHENVSNKFKEKNLDEIASELMREFNEKYNDKLSDEEKKVVKELSESTDKEIIFNKYKEICINKVNEAKSNFEKEGNTESVNKLTSISEQINKKVFTENTVENDICNFIEITNIF